MDITFDMLKKAVSDSGGSIAAGAGQAFQPAPAASGTDPILKYADAANSLLRTANEILTNIAQLKNNPALGEMMGRKISQATKTEKELPVIDAVYHVEKSDGGVNVSADKVLQDLKDLVGFVKGSHGNMTLEQAHDWMGKNTNIIIGFLKDRGYS